MAGQWREVAKLSFRGERFRDHALDLSALTELRQFQKIVAETAKALWRAAHPDRERLPAHFEDRTRLCLRRIDEGSAVAPLEVYMPEPEQGELWEPEPKEVGEAIELAYKVLDCAAKDRPLPAALPRDAVPEYAEWGRSLGEGEEVEFLPAGKRRGVKVSATTRERLARFVEQPHPTTIVVQGEVLAADVRQRRFQLWREGDVAAITVSFTPEQEDEVTTALKDHRSLRMEVRGVVEASPEGRPLRFLEVERMRILHVDALFEYVEGAPPIEEIIEKIWADLPDEEWARLPSDLTDRLDDYIYGPDE